MNVEGLDYAKFRLFQLSILWRASVSTHEFFKNVDLGKHEEILRGHLLSGSPGPSARYGCLMFGLVFEKNTFTQLIMPPIRRKVAGHTAYRFIFGGFAWVFIVSSHDILPPLSDAFLKPAGSTLLGIKDVREIRDLASFSMELMRLGRNQ